MKFSSYLHLNTSFSNDLGLSNGKLAVVLYFAFMDNPYHKINISVSFLEEVLTQINAETPLTFGSGIAGVGVLVGYLNRKGILEENLGELLSSVEPMLVQQCMNRLVEIDLLSGTSGLGLYFLSRIKYSTSADNGGSIALFSDCIVNSVSQISCQLPVYGNLKVTAPLFTIWHGLPGIYLYLQQVCSSNISIPSIENLIQKSEHVISQWLHQCPLCWEMVEAYFVLLMRYRSKRPWLDSFTKFIIEISKAPIDFCRAAWYALLLKIIGVQYQFNKGIELSHRIESYVKENLANQGLKMVFPFDPQQNCVSLGLEGGVCGMALPLLSLETGDYEWLSLLGVHLEGKLIRK